MFSYQEKVTRHTRRQTNKQTQFEETEQASEPGMATILELSDQQFKTTVINTLKALMDKVDGMK